MSKSHAVNLSSKVVLLLCGLFTAYGAADYIVQREVILPSFEALEADLARTDMERATRAIDSELTQLQTFGADWGNWLETYDFMAGNAPDFIENNMNKATIESAGLELVAYLDADARFVWRKGFDPDTHDDLEFRMLAADSLATGHPFRDAIKNGQPAKGIVVTEHGPAMLVAAPILDGAGNGPHRGSVMLARLITPDSRGTARRAGASQAAGQHAGHFCIAHGMRRKPRTRPASCSARRRTRSIET